MYRRIFIVLAGLLVVALFGNTVTTRLFGFGTLDAEVIEVGYNADSSRMSVQVQVRTSGPSNGRRVLVSVSEELYEQRGLKSGQLVRINLDERGNAILN